MGTITVGKENSTSIDLHYVQDVGRWNAENEAEDRNVRVEHHAHLIIETRRHVRCVGRQGNVECGEMIVEREKAPVERRLI